MKKVTSRVALFVLLLGSIFASCNRGETFIVEGVISSAEGDTLYLEHRKLGGVELIDSVVLKADGSFRFSELAPTNPEFYQLRIGSQTVAFAIDSTETLNVIADANNLYDSFTVENSYSNNQLKRVNVLRRQTMQEITSLEKLHDSSVIDDMDFLNQLDTVLIDYKSEISNLILANPSSAAAYYAVFQQINDYLIFDPYNRQDYSMFGAVATAWNRSYPESERTIHLYNFTINALQARRRLEQQNMLFESLTVENEMGAPEISLPGVNGERVVLSSLKGRVVLLDFVVYNAEFSPAHNINLNTLYRRYGSQNFEIYQVSLDSDEHFWKISANNLPWVTVRDPQSVATSLLSTFNVREIPTGFLIDREGDIITRVEDYSQLPELLNKVL